MNIQSSFRDYALQGHGFLRWRWLIFGLLVPGYIFLELKEHLFIGGQISGDLLLEIVLFATPLGIALLMYERLLGAITEKNRAVSLLNEKNRLILQLAEAKEWDELVDQIVQYPSSIAPVIRSWLQVYHDDFSALKVEAVWTPEEGTSYRSTSMNPLPECGSCPLHSSPTETCLQACVFAARNSVVAGENVYCLPIYYGSTLNAMLGFALPKGKEISAEQSMILSGNSVEIASALEAAREQKARRLSDLANAARAERLMIARDLHDTLGQNLGYLHLKLDQFARDNGFHDLQVIKPDVEQMRIVADESYELVRGALAILHQDDDARLKLCELLEVHGQMVAKRAGLEFSHTCRGKSRHLPVKIVRQIYFAAKEAYYNIERHAGACKMSVAIDWGAEDLTIKIDDDGQGFNQQLIQKGRHFGLDIMQERLQACNGRMTIETTPGCGTHIEMWLPTTSYLNE
jgi:signal transduction histidine kinase